VSQLGSHISQLAILLAAILALDASAFEVAALGAIEFLPFLLFTLPAGVWVDRLPRRPILIWSDVGRAIALLSIPLACALGALTIWQLFAVGVAVGTLTVFFDVAYQSYLPALVGRDELVSGNSLLEVSRSGAQIAGPGIGGLLVGALGAP
jgi:MFS family permease